MAQNVLNNKALEAFSVPRDVYNAIQNAAKKTGVNFTYLMEKAAVESSFNPDAKAKTSSATGLFQFIESTWLSMVKEHGGKYGLSKYADKIDDNNRVGDPKARREILNLRKDPEIASLMAAEFATENYNTLKQNVGGEIGSTELYLAHFLGASGASGFLNAMKKSPNMAAADVFPKEARSNRNVFYDAKTGAPRSLKQVYAMFDRKFDDGAGTTNFASRTVMTNENNLRVANNYAGRPAPTAAAAGVDDDPFVRLATLMGTEKSGSVLRLSDAGRQDNWQIFPPSLYNRLSLSPAQMMMLSDFNA